MRCSGMDALDGEAVSDTMRQLAALERLLMKELETAKTWSDVRRIDRRLREVRFAMSVDPEPKIAKGEG